MANEVRLIECRSCDCKNCSGCNVLTLANMLHNGDFDCLMDEHKSIAFTPESLRPKGRWIVEYDKYCKQWRHTCNRCGHSYTAVIEALKSYCSCCGAKMEG